MSDERRFRREVHVYREMVFIATGMVLTLSQLFFLRNVRFHFAMYNGWDWVSFAAALASLALIVHSLVRLAIVRE